MSQRLKYSLIMFIAGSFYGVVVPIVRTAYDHGYAPGHVMFSQYLVSAVMLFIVVLLFFRQRVAFKDILKLMGMGVVAAGVSFCYFRALELLPSATALTLLFQFVWIGVVIQAVRERKLPKPITIASVVLVMIGAVFATGLADSADALQNLDPVGVMFGLGSALFYAIYLMLSGKIATYLPAACRSAFSTLGSLIVAFAICPTYFSETPMLVSDTMLSISLGLVGICLPVFLIALSAPKLPPSLTTIMASSELPSGVICAMIFLGDPISLPVGAGVVLVLAGIVLSETTNLRKIFTKNST